MRTDALPPIELNDRSMMAGQLRWQAKQNHGRELTKGEQSGSKRRGYMTVGDGGRWQWGRGGCALGTSCNLSHAKSYVRTGLLDLGDRKLHVCHVAGKKWGS
jgi:hypothetical protein